MPEIIYTYEEFERYGKASAAALFWVVEYQPSAYNTAAERYSLVRNEILEHPQDYQNRLNAGVYRVWTTTPREIQWK